MSTDGDDGDSSFVVERILHQKKDADGETKYLVKWLGYPDEECTYEPEASFDGPQTLQDWQKQYAQGDRLDTEDIRRIEQQMDAFQRKQYASTNNSNTTSRSSSPQEPPRKKQKTANDTSLVRKKKGIARSVRSERSSPKIPKFSSEIGSKSKGDQLTTSSKSKASSGTTPLRSTSASPKQHADTKATTERYERQPAQERSKGVGIAMLPSDRNKAPLDHRTLQRTGHPQPASKPKFYAPDLNQCSRNTPNNDESSKKDLTGKSFRNLQHMNNARKLAASKRQPLPDPYTSLSISPVIEHSGSNMFFSESNDNSKTDMIAKNHEETPQLSTYVVTGSDTDESYRTLADTTRIARSSQPLRVHQTVKHSLLPEVVSSNIQLPLSELGFDHNAGSNRGAMKPAREDVRSGSVEENVPHKTQTIQTQTSASGSERTIICQGDRPAAIASATSNDVGETIEKASLGRILESQPRTAIASTSFFHEQGLQNNHDNLWEQSRNGRPSEPTQYAQFAAVPSQLLKTGCHRHEQLQHGYDEEAKTKRTWFRGDVVAHLKCCELNVGAMKLINLPWEHSKNFMNLKSKENKSLILDFTDTITRQRYDRVSSEQWSCYLAVGVVEPFEDNASSLDALAELLERGNTAAIWEHPTEDLTVLLYSCHAPDWNALGHKPGRDYSPRLQVALRQKFNKVSLSPLNTSNNDALHLETQDLSVGQENSQNSAISVFKDTNESGKNDHNSIDFTSDGNSLHYHTKNTSFTPCPISRHQNEMGIVLQSLHDATADIEVDIHKGATGQEKYNLISNYEHQFKGLDTTIQELGSYNGRNDTIDKAKVFVLLAYKEVVADRVQLMKSWLIENGVGWDMIFDKTVAQDWSRFADKLMVGVCVILFDTNYPIAGLTHLSKAINENDNLICWQIDFRASLWRQFPAKRLFIRGIALTVCEGCFVSEPENILKILKWLREYIKKPYPASSLLLPPGITDVLLDQAQLAKDRRAKKLFVDLAAVVEDLVSISNHSIFDGGHAYTNIFENQNPSSFSVIMPDWEAVYREIAQNEVLSKMEQRLRDEEKDKSLFNYFSVWALHHLTDYRRFVAIAFSDNKPRMSEHVRFLFSKKFLDSLVLTNKDKTDDKRRGRSESQARSGSKNRAGSRSRTRSMISTPGQSPSFA